MIQSLKPGIYKHYKGNEYQVIDTATHSEDETMYVVYRPLYGDRKLWIRPLKMFTEMVNVDNTIKPRFEYLRDA